MDHPFNFDVTQGGTLFFDPDGDPLTYRVTIPSVGLGQPWQGLTVSGVHIVGVPTAVDLTGVSIEVEDGRGGGFLFSFVLKIRPNAAPIIVHPNIDQVLGVGANVDYEFTQNGEVFSDLDGDALSYRATLGPLPRGLRVEGTRIVGALDSIGAVFVRVRAEDGFGGSIEDLFAVAAPAIETRRPTLPPVSYIYDDAELTLPHLARFSREHFAPFWDTTPPNNPTTNAGATLGRVLFYDKRLSITNLGSCGSCHHQQHGFAAPEPFSAGPQGELTRRNVMGLTGVRYNLNDVYFGDSRVVSLERLVPLPIEEPTELGNSMPLLVEKLAATDFYPPLFEAAFGTPDVTADRISKALAQFMRSMIAFNTKFDRAFHPIGAQEVSQPETVLTPQELRGAEVFRQGRCMLCHEQGAQTLDQPANNGLDAEVTDPGSGNGRFRTASLRNIAVTAPYMHDGRFATLREVIEHYSSGAIKTPRTDSRMRDFSTGSVTRNLTEEDKDALEAFLHTLTDQDFLTDPKFSDPFE